MYTHSNLVYRQSEGCFSMKGNVTAAAHNDILTTYAAFSSNLKKIRQNKILIRRQLVWSINYVMQCIVSSENGSVRYTLPGCNKQMRRRGRKTTRPVSNTKFHHKLQHVSCFQQEQRWIQSIRATVTHPDFNFSQQQFSETFLITKFTIKIIINSRGTHWR